VWRPPASARNVDLYGFVVAADRDAIDELLQRYLVRPSGGAVDYRCAHPSVVVTVGTIGRESSLDPRDQQRGYLSENEVSVWCLVADMKAGNRLLWFLPYIFTDSEQTIATGREIFGYPKQLGYFEEGYRDRLGPAGGSTTIRTLGIKRFGPNAKAAPVEMITVTRRRGRRNQPSEDSLVQEFELFFREQERLAVNPRLPSGRSPVPSGAIVHRGAPVPAPPRRRAGAPIIRAIMDTLQGRVLSANPSDLIVDMVTHTTLVFLKQFRDASCSTKACYQAVIEAPLTIVDPLAATYQMLDPRLFELTFRSWDSDPLAHELGIRANRPFRPQRAFHATFGFNIDLGLEVWRAPT
jgi:hypothetical protein